MMKTWDLLAAVRTVIGDSSRSMDYGCVNDVWTIQMRKPEWVFVIAKYAVENLTISEATNLLQRVLDGEDIPGINIYLDGKPV
jgi:hypothetical protein